MNRPKTSFRISNVFIILVHVVFSSCEQSQECLKPGPYGKSWKEYCEDMGPDWECWADSVQVKCGCKEGFTEKDTGDIKTCVASLCTTARDDGRIWNDYCSEEHGPGAICQQGSRWFFNVATKCACGPLFKEDNSVGKMACKARTCSDLVKSDIQTWTEFCQEKNHHECQEVENFGPHCVCAQGYAFDGHNLCLAAPCLENHPIFVSRTWENVCSSRNKECTTDDDNNATCGDCRKGYTSGPTPEDDCIVDQCLKLHPIVRSLKWKDACASLNKECVHVNNKNPRCGPCKKGFKPGATSVHPCIDERECKGFKDGTLAWTTFCEKSFQFCEEPVDGGPPHCGECIHGTANATTGECAGSKCESLKEANLTWTSFCGYSNQDCEEAENGGDPRCGGCREGFVNGTGGCVELQVNRTCLGVDAPVKGVREGKCEGAQPGENCVITCLDGFSVRGHTNLTCKENGTWDYLPPICVTNKPSPCQEEKENGQSWGAFCHQAGATCEDSGTTRSCICQGNQIFDGSACKEISPCGLKHSPGKSWNTYCRTIGGSCYTDARMPYCTCPEKQSIQDGVCKELTVCVNLKVDGTEWNKFCRDAGGYCVSVGGYPACHCPEGQTFRAGICRGTF